MNPHQRNENPFLHNAIAILLAMMPVAAPLTAEPPTPPRDSTVTLEPASTAQLDPEAELSATPLSRTRPVLRPVPEWIEAIDDAAETALDRGVPGLEVAVRLGNEFAYEKAYGVTSLENQTPTATDSPFEIGSITKQFVAAGIMRLVEGGELHVADPLAEWVPELDTHGYHPTLRHLLAHTSGVPNYTDYLTDFETPMTEAQMVDYIGTLPWSFEPGSGWQYSNSGYYLLGMVIERATGEAWVDTLDENFIRPLGLIHTSYCGSNPAMPRPIGYVEWTPGTIEQSAVPDISLLFSAGGICSTAGDLVRWNVALTRGRAVSPASYEEMSTDAGLDNGTPTGYGYGLMVTTYRGHRVILHGGATFGFLSHLAWYPDYDLTIAVLTNLRGYTSNWSQSVGLGVARVILDDLDARNAQEMARALRVVNW